MADRIVFYSWQSWTDSASNRNFIEDCLERAIKEIVRDEFLRLYPVMDRDTEGRPGSPDIADTILDKIAAAAVFVADVTLVHGAGTGRAVSNPNVLVELGYALSQLGADKVLCVHNLSSGRIEELPFDLRGRRVLTYSLPAKTDGEQWLSQRTAARIELTGKLKHAIVASLSTMSQEAVDLYGNLISCLHTVIILGEEAEDRNTIDGMETLRREYHEVATKCRKWMASSIVLDSGFSDVLGRFTEALEAVAFPANVLTSHEKWRKHLALVKEVVNQAWSIRKTHFSQIAHSRREIADIRNSLVEWNRELQSLSVRCNQLLNQRDGDTEVVRIAGDIGWQILRRVLMGLEPLWPGIDERLKLIGKRLHGLGFAQRFAGGPQRKALAIREEITDVASQLNDIVQTL